MVDMNPLEKLRSQAPTIEAKLGYIFKNKELLALAFVHCSFINEFREVTSGHNERLEFLGDAVLSLIIADHLYRHMPHVSEGDLSHLRSCIVDAHACFTYIQKLDVSSYLLLAKGEQRSDNRGRETILADLFEAIIGAIYLDGGFEAARDYFFKEYHEDMDAILRIPARNFKSLLQNYVQKAYHQTPSYQIINQTGPEHDKIFEVAVFINNSELGRGCGGSKKNAQQAAAADALGRLNIPIP